MRGRRPTLKAIVGGKAKADAAPTLLPPRHLPKTARPEWKRVCADLQERGLLEPSMASLIASYCVAIWQVGQCVKAIERDGAFVRTKLGEPKPHPAHGLLNKAQEIVARLGAELGLTPSARARKGLQGQEPKDDDGAPADLDL
jgi:P27 family predicted phage terminase small subunit